ncbi:type VII secretion target [Pseudonocardia hydrocarbonoxydans]|uniref:ESX-1 secretion-associated protein n=1 Tax=Pseudonocardia hydrocarbonoxydans TaxID=76726 RepID=A0A4Y3WLU3_9PSEU|nr:type VII secretion target [Pseudonocardia hydrocarbonoxydans]GEC19020.1 hypothetical protein PHY01_13030 [Pseudonocardia hydrocarbonoxydans]
MSAEYGFFRLGDIGPHIDLVDRSVAAPMRRAADAGQPLDHLAYGLVGQAFAVTVTAAAAIGAHAVRGLGDEAAGFGDRLRTTRDAYEETERRTALLFGHR